MTENGFLKFDSNRLMTQTTFQNFDSNRLIIQKPHVGDHVPALDMGPQLARGAPAADRF